jgi:hypothetical protein
MSSVFMTRTLLLSESVTYIVLCQIDIVQKRQIITNLDQQLNQKIYAFEKLGKE